LLTVSPGSAGAVRGSAPLDEGRRSGVVAADGSWPYAAGARQPVSDGDVCLSAIADWATTLRSWLSRR